MLFEQFEQGQPSQLPTVPRLLQTCRADASPNSISSFEDAVTKAREEPGSVFIGVVVEADELQEIVGPRLENAAAEAAAYVAGSRRRR